MTRLVAVDGHNVVNGVMRHFVTADQSRLRRYLLEWFDIDRLVSATLGASTLDPWQDLGIVLFHSNKQVGEARSTCAFGGQDGVDFWSRQGAAPSSSAMLVDVPGARSGKDVGMDVAIVVYLFETLARWDGAVLFTEDADFVPAVWSLRRQGKRIHCSAAKEDSATGLIRACQHYFPWDLRFLEADWALFNLMLEGNAIERLFESPAAKGATLARLALEGDSLAISPACTGGGDNALNEALGEIGARHLHAQDVGSCIRITTTGMTPGLSLQSNMLVFDGMRRHPSVAQSGPWRDILRMDG